MVTNDTTGTLAASRNCSSSAITAIPGRLASAATDVLDRYVVCLAAPREYTAGIIPLDVLDAGEPPESTTGSTACDGTDVGGGSRLALEETTGACASDDLKAGAMAPPPAAALFEVKTARVPSERLTSCSVKLPWPSLVRFQNILSILCSVSLPTVLPFRRLPCMRISSSTCLNSLCIVVL